MGRKKNTNGNATAVCDGTHAASDGKAVRKVRFSVKCSDTFSCEYEDVTLARFKDGETWYDQLDAKTKALHWIENAVYAITDGLRGHTFLDELEEIRKDCLSKDGTLAFNSCSDMPLSIINLVLKKYNLELEEEEVSS